MNPSIKVLILYASVGEGHRSAALAVQAAIQEAASGAVTDCVDVLQYAHPLFRKIYSGGYVSLLQKAPTLVAALYKKFDGEPPGRSLLDQTRLFLEEFGLPKFEKYLKEKKWDLIINTHFLPSEIVAAMKRRKKISAPHVTVTTDFMTHKLWVHEPCDHYFTATREGSGHLENFGVAKEKITAAGIPIKPGFHPNGFSPKSRPIILVIGGGLGLGPLLEIYEKLLTVDIPLSIQIVAGKNERMKSDLEKVAAPRRHEVSIYGFTDKMADLMASADLIVTKPGGLSVSEALASGAAICVVNPFPGQEDFNAEFLLRNQAGIIIPDLDSIPSAVTSLLKDKKKVENMKKNSHNLSKPHAARTIAEKSLAIASLHGPRN